MADLVNAFATGYGIGRSRRLDRAAAAQNAFTQGRLARADELAEKNSLLAQAQEARLGAAAKRASQAEQLGMIQKLDTVAMKAAHAADTEDKWAPHMAFVASRVERAKGFGLDPEKADAMINILRSTSFADRDVLLSQGEPVDPIAALRSAAAGGAKLKRQQEILAGIRQKERDEKPGSLVSVNVESGRKYGKIPEGHVLIEEDGKARFERVAGGPLQEKEKRQQDVTRRYSGVVFKDMDRLREKIEESPWHDPVLGISGAVVSKLRIPKTNRIDAEALIKTIVAGIGFDRLREMRLASPTGGSLGQVSNLEIEYLQSTLGNLSLAQSEDQLLATLDRANGIYAEILRKAQAYPNAAEFGFGGEGAPQTLPLVIEDPNGRRARLNEDGQTYSYEDTGAPVE